GFALAMAFLWPAATEGLPRVLVITGLIAALTWVNVIGVKQGAGTAVALLIAKAIPLAIFVMVGLFFVDWATVGALQAPDPGVLGETALLLLFAYARFETTPAAAGEYKNPQRDVPFALLTMIATLTLLYTGVQLVALGTLPGVATAESPVAESAALFMGAGGALLMTVGALISIGGNVGNTVLVGPRYLFALA